MALFVGSRKAEEAALLQKRTFGSNGLDYTKAIIQP
jgi:hypothetical protein